MSFQAVRGLGAYATGATSVPQDQADSEADRRNNAGPFRFSRLHLAFWRERSSLSAIAARISGDD
jgi:hypothetical protein